MDETGYFFKEILQLERPVTLLHETNDQISPEYISNYKLTQTNAPHTQKRTCNSSMR